MFTQNQILLYFTAGQLFLIDGKGVNKLELNAEIIKNQEIVSPDKLAGALTGFIQSINISKGQVIIVLSSDLIFQKSFTIDKTTSEQQIINQFIEEIPFQPENILSLRIRNPDTVQIIATNKNLFQEIKMVLEKLSYQVRAVVPSSVFGEGVNEAYFTPQTVKTIFQKADLFKNYNFLKATDSVAVENEDLDDNPKKQQGPVGIIMLIFGVICLIAITVFIFYRMSLRGLNSNQPKTGAVPSETVFPSETLSPTAVITTAETVNKKDLKINILNASGIPGQAKIVQEKLVSAGFSNIEIGNNEETVEGKSIIKYTAGVDKQTQIELSNNLTQLLGEITFEEDNNINGDIVIIIGKQS